MYEYAGFCEILPDLLARARGLQITPGPGGSGMTNFEETLGVYQDLYPAAHQITIVSLQPSSQIVLHRDAPIRGRRFHTVLQMNDGCWVMHGGKWQQLLLGRVYEMDPTEAHGAVNWGSEVRLHLMVDQDG